MSVADGSVRGEAGAVRGFVDTAGADLIEHWWEAWRAGWNSGIGGLSSEWERTRVTRSDFQKLAEERIADAEALLLSARFGAAYYFSGFAVECALKACVAKKTSVFDFPDLKRAQSAHQHDLERLVETAELKTALDQQMLTSQKFKVNWNTVKQWRNETRYDPSSGQSKAQELFASATENNEGVLPWLRTVW